MKRLICAVMTAAVLVCSTVTNVCAMQDDVKAAYKNELQWIAKSQPKGDNGLKNNITYCTYDMDKDGIKELSIKIGTCEADYKFMFYTCEYGKIIKIGEFNGFHSSLYECDSSGVFVYGGHMGYEWLYKVVKNGQSVTSYQIYENDLNPYFSSNSNPWHTPERYITTYDCTDYTGLT